MLYTTAVFEPPVDVRCPYHLVQPGHLLHNIFLLEAMAQAQEADRCNAKGEGCGGAAGGSCCLSELLMRWHFSNSFSHPAVLAVAAASLDTVRLQVDSMLHAASSACRPCVVL